MNTKLKDLAYTADENECGAMLDELLSFGEVPLSESEQNDIISRVTRKAEEDMTTTTARKKISRKFITFIVAAALAVPIGAFAVSQLMHKDNVDYYMKGSERIEQNENAVKNYVMENENFKITVDAQLCDGHNLITIESHDAKNSDAQRMLQENPVFNVDVEYADKSGKPDLDSEMRQTGYAIGNHASTGDAVVNIFPCKPIDANKDIKMIYSRYAGADTIPLEGFEFTTNAKPNVKSIELRSADGKKMILSEFEVYSPDNKQLYEMETDAYTDFAFIKNNGEKVALDVNNNISGFWEYLIFGEIIDPDDYKGVEIGGVEYLKQ